MGVHHHQSRLGAIERLDGACKNTLTTARGDELSSRGFSVSRLGFSTLLQRAAGAGGGQP